MTPAHAALVDSLLRNDPRTLDVARSIAADLGYLPARVALYLSLLQDDDDELRERLRGVEVRGVEVSPSSRSDRSPSSRA